MLKANSDRGVQHEWLSIQYVPEDKSWYAWYMTIVDFDMIRGEIGDGN
jgi:hypothetical protein